MSSWETDPDDVITLRVNNTEYGLKKVNDLSLGFELIAEKARSAGGQMRMTVVTHKRSWSANTSPLSPNDVDALITALRNIHFTKCEMQLDTFGANEWVDVYVEIDNIDRINFGEGGAWYKDGKELSLTIEEA